MAKNPDPTLELATSAGVTRTLDDWTTMFHLCLVILPDRPEAALRNVASFVAAVLHVTQYKGRTRGGKFTTC